MAEEKNDIILDGMPGADKKTEEEVKPFEVDLNFADETPAEDSAEEAPEEEEEVEFPNEEGEVIEEELTAEEEAVEEEDAEDIKDPEDQDEVEVPGEPEEEVLEDTTDIIEEEEIEKPQAPEKAPMVPKSRLDEVLAKNKKMQKQLDEIQQKEAQVQAEAPAYDFDTKEQEYQQLILDGESAKAVQLRNEIRQAEKEAMMFEMQSQMGQTVQQDRAAQELQAKAVEIAETFPILNELSPEYNEDLTREVSELRDAFIIQGYEPADSLAKATEYTLAAKHPELLRGADEITATTKQNKAVVEKRKKTTVKKKLEASKSQPPKMKGEGTANRKDRVADINVLSDDEFSALPEDTLKRMRGDFG